MPGRPPRLRGFDYIGMQRYFVTICTANRADVFRSARAVDPMVALLLHSAAAMDFAAAAYCFMPDHLHVLLVAESDHAALLECVRRFKQLSAFDYRRQTGGALWQAGYFEHALRGSEQTDAVARYILENPVRAGLCRAFQEYPFSGSSVYTKGQLADLWSEIRGT
jgi:putative transposase